MIRAFFSKLSSKLSFLKTQSATSHVSSVSHSINGNQTVTNSVISNNGSSKEKKIIESKAFQKVAPLLFSKTIKIKHDAPFLVIITHDTNVLPKTADSQVPHALLTASDKGHEAISVSVSGKNNLLISAKKLNTRQPTVLTLYFPKNIIIKSLEATSVGATQIHFTIEQADFSLTHNGVGTCIIKGIDCDTLHIITSGTGALEINSGQVKTRADINLHAMGKCTLNKLAIIGSAMVSHSGMGKVSLNLQGRANVTHSGMGSVDIYRPSINEVHVNDNGMGKIVYHNL
jgi:hypothetical protein